MNSTTWGLVASILGALVLGWVVPHYSVTRFDGGPARPEGAGRVWHWLGWGLLVAGFTLQPVGALR